MRRLLACLAAAAALLFGAAAPAFAAPLPYINAPMDTPNSAVNALVGVVNSNIAAAQYIVACTGTTTATCQGLRLNISVTGLTTAATAVSATVTVTDTLVTAASQVLCQPIGYAGTGIPNTVNVIPGAGSFTFQVQNSAASAALNATVVNACLVYN